MFNNLITSTELTEKSMSIKSAVLSLFLCLPVVFTACAPSTAETSIAVATTILEPSATPFQPVVSTEVLATQDPGVTSTPTQEAFPVATSRGPDLHATDPTTVSLASGQYQFVEFFRFT